MASRKRRSLGASISSGTARSNKARAMVEHARSAVQSMDNEDFGQFYLYAVEQLAYNDNGKYLAFIRQLREPPVSIQEFLDSDQFMGATDLTLWPEVRKALITLNKDWWRGWNVAKGIAILGGSTSSGKTEMAKVTLAYHTHILGCMKNPQTYWGLPSATSIAMTIQAAKPKVTKNIIYLPLRSYIEAMPWFQRHMRPDRLLEAEMYFPTHNVRIVQGGSDTDSLLGDAIIGGCFPKEQKFITGAGLLLSMEEALNYPVRVKTTSKKSNRIISSEPTKAVYTGKKKFIRLRFSNGAEIVCTGDQKFRNCHNSWVEADNAKGVSFRYTYKKTMLDTYIYVDRWSVNPCGEVPDDVFHEFYDNDKVQSVLIKCIGVEEASVELEDCYDLEDTGPTHSFFAEAGDGFLEAKNCIDEINFMNVVEKSKRAALGVGRSGAYDQAQAVFDTLTRRKEGRFRCQGPNVGVILASSSTRYVGDFTDRTIRRAREQKLVTYFLYEKAQYDVHPADKYCGEKFRLLVSTDNAMDIRIMEPDEEERPHHTIEYIPIEYREEFRRDPAGAMRDIVGKSASSINPFFRQAQKITNAVIAGEEAGLESFLHKDNVVLATEGMPQVVQGHYCRNPSKPRYVHVDLSLTSDRVGISMVRYDGMTERGRSGGESELLPMVTVEMMVTIEPDQGHEIDIAEIRHWVKLLKSRYGYPIRTVTYDSFSSIESIQAWRRSGMRTGSVSVDRSSTPYKQFREAFYDGRIIMYNNPIAIEELLALEYDEKKDKIDHPPGFSKDCADSICAAYHTLLTRSETWSMSEGDGMDNRADFGERTEDEYRAA